MQFSTPSSARTINRLRVLNLLAREGEFSRSDIARRLTLNKPSTSEIVEQLLQEGLVEEKGKAKTANGRRPTTLALQHGSRLVLGVELGSKNTCFTLTDLLGNVLRFERIPTPIKPDAKEHGLTVIKACLKMRRITKAPIAGITVATSAQISEDGLSILRHDHWSWENVPLAKAISEYTQTPAILVHSVRAMVEAEQWFADEDEKSFLYVNWGEHISGALVQDNTIVGEKSRFGHLPVRQTGLCRCGGIGCLETVAAGWALSERFAGKTVKELAQREDPEVIQALQEAAEAMGMALTAASAITGCNKIILGGGISNLPDHYLSVLQKYYHQHAHHSLAHIPVVRSQLKDRSAVLGSVAVGLDRWIFQRRMLQTMQGL
ncbi:ROK family transcriptional regulator [Sphaerochaeta sp. S2]|uniref:ROK family transcriptional regulator n=1 Tax=Sphaerochaeta sp. S2 TaxID=2798868 RepID=UPI0018E9FF48|nr:ROK family transcriptional regulator [Sphaerochaeta sp. S2]MBJ2355904.1 ROK family transcriptional regulator [Sphaerochaeta sp. S2]